MINLTFDQKINIGFQYVLDKLEPCSPYGSALVKKMKPYSPKKRAELEAELDNVERALNNLEPCRDQIAKLEHLFMTTKDIFKIFDKCAENPLNEIELFEIKRFLLQCSEIVPLFSKLNTVLTLNGCDMICVDKALDILDPDKMRIAGFHVSDSHSQTLRAIRRKKREIEELIRREQNQNRKDELMSERTRIAADEDHEEQRVRALLSSDLIPYLDAMRANAHAIGRIDLTIQKARIAKLYGAAKPSVTAGEIELLNLTNPQICDLLSERGGKFTPVSIDLERGANVITGANMGGKSVALKTVALNVYLCHCGFFAFAERASTPIFESMHLVSEDLQSVDRGLSSFGAEIVRINEVIKSVKNGGAFVLLDEFARGTNPDEGALIVQSMVKYLTQKGVFSLVTTHYDGVAEHGAAHYQVIGLGELNLEQVRSEIAAAGEKSGPKLIAKYMNYGLYRVAGKHNCPRDALNICRLLALDSEILSIIEKSY